MANTKDITSANSNILLIGDSGSHKTWLLGHVPGIYIFDFDKRLTVLRGTDVEYDTFKDLGKGMKGGTGLEAQGLYTFGGAWEAFWKRVIELNELYLKGKGPPAIGLDSLTFMSMIAINNILKNTGHDSAHQGTWGAHHEYFKTVLSMMTAWPCRLIATAHIERSTNELTQVSEKLPLIAGKLAGLLPAFFDETYFCDVAPNAKTGGLDYILHTQLTQTMRQAKSSWGVPEGTPTDWEAIKKYLPTEPGVHIVPATVVQPKALPPKPAIVKAGA